MEKPDNRSRLKLGNNWWSRLLVVLYIGFLLSVFLAPVVRSGLIKVGALNALITGIAIWLLWKLVQWIVNGSTHGLKASQIIKGILGVLGVLVALGIILFIAFALLVRFNQDNPLFESLGI